MCRMGGCILAESAILERVEQPQVAGGADRDRAVRLSPAWLPSPARPVPDPNRVGGPGDDESRSAVPMATVDPPAIARW